MGAPGRGGGAGGELGADVAVSEGVARDKTEDWLLPEASRPRTFSELEARIEYAVAVARSSEAAVAEIGAAALDAAEQARRAAEMAELAAASAAGVEPPNGAATFAPAADPGATVLAGPEAAGPPRNPALYPLPPDEDLRLAHFMERADRVVERLRALEKLAG
jgi:hypothetical protein